MFTIPIIDISNWYQSESVLRLEVATNIHDAIVNYRCFYLVNHPIQSEVIDKAYESSKRFHKSEESFKMKYHISLSKHYRGYVTFKDTEYKEEDKEIFNHHNSFDISY